MNNLLALKKMKTPSFISLATNNSKLGELLGFRGVERKGLGSAQRKYFVDPSKFKEDRKNNKIQK